MSQKGFIYEKNAYNALLLYGISAGGPPAGAASDRPDLDIKLSTHTTDSQKQGCELKISPTDAGSLAVKYTDGKWWLDTKGARGNPEKMLLIAVAQKHNILQHMNTSGHAGKNWRGKAPYLQNDKSGKKIVVPPAKNKPDAYKRDIKQFGGTNEVRVSIPAKTISDYYNTKKTYYLNVGTHGFYLMNKDPLQLNKRLPSGSRKIPDFSQSAKAQIRVRCQSKQSGNRDYQFVMALQFTSITKSPYNLAPITTAKNVAIDMSRIESIQNEPLLTAFRK